MTSRLLGDEITLRPATGADVTAISRIMNYPPEPPLAAALGPDRASRIGDLLVRGGLSLSVRQSTVAILDGAVVGVMDAGGQYPTKTTVKQVVALLPRALAIIGPTHLPRALSAVRVRSFVRFDPLDGAYPVDELYVDEACRNRGVGGRLLQHAEELARREGFRRMSIETGITNPARRLYERNGYRVFATKADERYERVTESPGRVQLLKELS